MVQSNQSHHLQSPSPQRTRALLGVISEGFFSRLSFGLIAFALPLYARHLGLSVAQIGLLASLNIAVSMALKPFIGWIADRIGYKRGATLSIGLRSLMVLLLVAASTPLHLYLLQASRGVAKALRDPAMHALIADRSAKKQLAATFAWYQTAKGTASSIGKGVAGVILTLTASNFSWVFGLAFLLSVLPLIAVSVLIPKGKSSPPDKSPALAQSPFPTAPPLKTGRQTPPLKTNLLLFVGYGFLLSSIGRMLRSLMPLLLVEYAGLSAAQAGFFYLVSTIVTLVSTPVFGWLYDRASRKWVLMTRSLTNVASSILYWVSPTFAGFLSAKVCDRIGTAAFRPAWAAMMAEISAGDKSKRARIIGLMSAGEDAGTVVGPLLAGLIWSAWGVAALLGTRIVLALLAELYTLRVVRVMHRPTLSGMRINWTPTAMGSCQAPLTKAGENQPSYHLPRR
ncbi:MAG: MFS transporter [Leptolyngbyaceae cyanobacterium MO_188.B28]|nr:MFS transporter [Leptolyngbyaceae cyanobacterium MO_188.B28]